MNGNNGQPDMTVYHCPWCEARFSSDDKESAKRLYDQHTRLKHPDAPNYSGVMN
jgi:hypothetical protein